MTMIRLYREDLEGWNFITTFFYIIIAYNFEHTLALLSV